MTAMRDNGVRRAAVFTTSAWGGYSSCTQYIEDVARGRAAAGAQAPELVKLRHYFDHPLFVEMFADAIAAAAATLAPALRDAARLVFTAHSIPVAADHRHGPNLYSRQVAYAARLVAAAAGHHEAAGYDLVWRSRSGPPADPLAGARCRRPPGGAGRRGHQGGDRLPDRLRRRPHRGGLGSRQRTARTGRRSRHRAGAHDDAQRGPPIRPSGGRSHRRTADRRRSRPAARTGSAPGCGHSVDGEVCAVSPRCQAKIVTTPRRGSR